MTSENKREAGDDFEDHILSKLGPGFKKTAGSGSVYKNGDIQHRNLIVECKFRSDDTSFSFPKTEAEKLKKQADKECKDWIYIKQINKKTQPFVLMDLNTFLELSEYWRKEHQ